MHLMWKLSLIYVMWIRFLRHMLNPDFITISTVSMPLLKHVILSRNVGLQFWTELQNPIIKLWENRFLLRFEGLWCVLTFQPNEVWDMTHVGIIIAGYIWKDSRAIGHIFSHDGNKISNVLLCSSWKWSILSIIVGVCEGAVGWRTVLQTRSLQVWFPMVLSEFFINIILTALWPWGQLRIEYQGCFLGG